MVGNPRTDAKLFLRYRQLCTRRFSFNEPTLTFDRGLVFSYEITLPRGLGYWQSARALAVHCPKPLATMLRMTEQT